MTVFADLAISPWDLALAGVSVRSHFISFSFCFNVQGRQLGAAVLTDGGWALTDDGWRFINGSW